MNGPFLRVASPLVDRNVSLRGKWSTRRERGSGNRPPIANGRLPIEVVVLDTSKSESK